MQIVLYPRDLKYTYSKFWKKLVEECDEVKQELKEPIKEDLLLSEVFDVLQACHNFLYNNFDSDIIEKANLAHLDKMKLKEKE